MNEVSVPSTAGGTSYFLISYSHTAHNGRRNDKGSQREPDQWVIDFYNDLCRNVEELSRVSAGRRPGILDRYIWVENDWCTGLPEALATCRVLVPLYSRFYFQSKACGQEWYVFIERALSRDQLAPGPAIVPVLWSPTPADSVHPTARTQPVDYHGVASYERRGVEGIIKQTKYRDDYERVVREVARRIVTVAGQSADGPWPVVGVDRMPNAFAPEPAPRPGAARLLITVVAPQRDDLPVGRGEQEYYGATARDWNPYPFALACPIAEYVANFARSLGYQPYIGDLAERAEVLTGARPAAHPELLIIDPWSVTRLDCQRLLARFSLAEKPWIQVVIPWNPADYETMAAAGLLRQALATALRHKLERGRAISAVAVEGVPGLPDLDAVLPLLVHAAGRRYLEHATAWPPGGPVVEKPQLDGPQPGPLDFLERTGG